MAYFNDNNDLTNRFDDKDYATQLLNGSFREDAETSIYGGGGQIAFRPDDSNLVTVALDAHREAGRLTDSSASSINCSDTPKHSPAKLAVLDASQQSATCQLAGRNAGTLVGPITSENIRITAENSASPSMCTVVNKLPSTATKTSTSSLPLPNTK